MFNENMLPLLGVVWHKFESLEPALRFAKWAEMKTANHDFPCRAYVTDAEDGDGYMVKVTNW